MTDVGRLLKAGWDAFIKGDVPRAAAVSDARAAPCSLCHGAGEIEVDGVFVSCPAPRHRAEESAR